MVKKTVSVILALALSVGTAACGGNAQSTQSAAKDVSSKSVSVAESGSADSSAKELSQADSLGIASSAGSLASDVSTGDSSMADTSSAADVSSEDRSAEDVSSADSSSEDVSQEDSSAAESLAGDTSSSEEPTAKSRVHAENYEIVPWEYEEYEPIYLSGMKEDIVYEAAHCGDMVFLNDTEKDYIIYYESDKGEVGTLPFAAGVLEGLAIEDPVGYINKDDVVRVRVEEVDPFTLDRDTEGVVFVDELKKGKKIRYTSKYMLINGGQEDVSVRYKTMEGDILTVTLMPGAVVGFEFLSVEGAMRIV